MHVIVGYATACDICGAEHPASHDGRLSMTRSNLAGGWLNHDLGRGWVNSYESVEAWTSLDAEFTQKGNS
jgi:hypothetical protein